MSKTEASEIVRATLLTHGEIALHHLNIIRDAFRVTKKVDDLKSDVQLLAVCLSLDYDFERAENTVKAMNRELTKLKGESSD